MTTPSIRYGCAVGALSLSLVAITSVAPAARQQGRTVGGNAEQISIDFMATGPDGMPVLDLSKDAITLKVGGKNRVINSLQLVKMEPPAAGTTTAPAEPVSNFPPPFVTNQKRTSSGAPGRDIYVVVDTESIRSGEEGPVRSAILAMASKLNANDQVSLVAVPHGGTGIELTTDREKLKAAVDTLRANGQANEASADLTLRTRLCLEKLQGILREMVGNDHPSTIIYMSSSMISANPAGIDKISAKAGTTAANAMGDSDLDPEEFNRIRELAGAARAELYVVEVEGGPKITFTSSESKAGSTDTQGGLRDVAGVGGGTFFSHVALGTEDALTRIARETGAYYLATFDADSGDKLNTRYPVAMSTSRKDVTLRVRSDLERTKATVTTKVPSIDEMFKTADPFRDLPLRLSAHSMRPGGADKDKGILVAAMGDLPGAPQKLTAAGFSIYDFTGRRVTKFDVAPADLGKTPFPGVMLVQPGKYRVRFAATDGKTSGAVDFPIEVGLVPAGPFKLGGILLVGPDGKPRMEFSNEPNAVAIFEMYGTWPAPPAEVTVELSLLGLASGPKELERAAKQTEADKFVVTVPIPLADLPPGDYQVKATVGVAGGATGTVTATVRKIKP